jgi:hypothetical protein
MNRGRAASLHFALALLIFAVAGRAAWAQAGPPPGGAQCNSFQDLAAEAQKRGSAVGAAIKAKADRKQICALMTTFVAAETKVIKFLDDNKVWCGVPEPMLATMTALIRKRRRSATPSRSRAASIPTRIPRRAAALSTRSPAIRWRDESCGRFGRRCDRQLGR